MPEPITAVKSTDSTESYKPSEVLVELTPAHIYGLEFINPQISAKVLGVVKSEDLEGDSLMVSIYYPEVLIFTVEQQLGMNGIPVPGSPANIVPMSKPIKVEKINNEYKILIPRQAFVFDVLSIDPLDIATHKKEYEDAVVKIKTEALANQSKQIQTLQ